MIMINANFTKQENQNPPAGDPHEKDIKTDDFTALIAGLCMTPQGNSTQMPVPEKPPEEIDQVGAEFPIPGNQAKPDPGALTDTKNSAFVQMLPPGGVDPKTVLNALDPGKELPPEDQQLNALTDRRGPKFVHFDGDIRPTPEVPVPIKPIVKDLKTIANRFDGVPAASAAAMAGGPIDAAKTFAAMAKEKAALVQSLANANGQIDLEPGLLTDDQTADQTAAQDFTHLDHNNVIDPLRVAEFIRDKSQRKLPRLISDVTEIAAEENASVLNGKFASPAGAPALSKMSALLEQIQPAVIQLAAAAMNEGKQVLKMRLHPAELGTVEIRLERNDAGVLEAHFKTDNETARHFLTQGLDGLRNSLQNAGWQVGRVEISSSPFSPGDSSSQRDAGRHNETSSTGSGDSNAKSFEPDSTRSDDTAGNAADRLVNLRA